MLERQYEEKLTTSRTSTPVIAGRSSRPSRGRSRSAGSFDLLAGQQDEDVLEVRRAPLALEAAPVRRRCRGSRCSCRCGGCAGRPRRPPPAPRRAARAGRRPRAPRGRRARSTSSAGGPAATALPCDMISTVSASRSRLLDVVRRHQDRRALRAERVDQRPELLAHLRVEPDGRLVEEDEARAVDECAGDQQPPAHAARELVDLVGAPVRRGWRSPARARSPRAARGAGSGTGARRRAGSARR